MKKCKSITSMVFARIQLAFKPSAGAIVIALLAMFLPMLAQANVQGLTTSLFASDNFIGGVRIALIVAVIYAAWALFQAFKSSESIFAPGLFFGVMLYLLAELDTVMRMLTTMGG